MREPYIMRKVDGSKTIAVGGLKDFIGVYIDDYNGLTNFVKALKDRHLGLEASTKAISKFANKADAKATLALLGVVGLGYLIKKRFVRMDNRILELERKYQDLQEDYHEVYYKNEELEAELYELNERLHAVAEKEEPKEG